jgi:RNA polymerase sigma-70 factor, ECF subfamily
MISNEDWIALLRQRDPARLAELGALLKRALVKALRTRRDVSDADFDDFAQDATMRILERLDSFRGDSRFTTWAIAIAIRVAFTALRRRRVFPASAAAAVEPADSHADPTRNADHDELLAVLQRAIDQRLTDRQRDAVSRFLTGVPQVRLAEDLRMTAGAFHKMMHDARLRLRQALESAGFDAAATLRLIDSPHDRRR